MVTIRRYQTALVLASLGFAVVPLTVAVALHFEWLSPHGDGMPTLFGSVIAMIALFTVAAQLMRSAPAESPTLTRRVHVLRRVALVGAILPATLLAALLIIVLFADVGR